jgi:aminoglycoside phosphotransferase (APT) family kinase protein
MQARLRPLLRAQGDLDVQLLKHVVGKRAVLLYRFADGRRLIGKMYRADRAQEQHTVLAALQQSLQGATRTPRPLACWLDLGLLNQEHMPGEAAPHWSEIADDEALLDRMAIALADLHGAPVEVGRQTNLADHVRRTCHPGLPALREALPHLGATLRDIETAMLAREAAIPLDRVLIHGDFGPGQVLWTPEQLSIVDLDGLSHGDAALDVANFVVGLRVHAGLAGRGLAQRFSERYQQRRGCRALPGLPHYQALAYVRRAMILLRKRPVGWEEQALQMVDRAASSL